MTDAGSRGQVTSQQVEQDKTASKMSPLFTTSFDVAQYLHSYHMRLIDDSLYSNGC